MKRILYVMSKLDLLKVVPVQENYSLGAIFSAPESVPSGVPFDAFCRLSFIKQRDVVSLYHFLSSTFKPDLIIIFDCYELRLLEGLYSIGCPVIKVVKPSDYCMRGDYLFRGKEACNRAVTPQCMSSCWSFKGEGRHYFHQLKLIKLLKKNTAVMVSSDDQKRALVRNGVSHASIVTYKELSFLEVLQRAIEKKVPLKSL